MQKSRHLPLNMSRREQNYYKWYFPDFLQYPTIEHICFSEKSDLQVLNCYENSFLLFVLPIPALCTLSIFFLTSLFPPPNFLLPNPTLCTLGVFSQYSQFPAPHIFGKKLRRRKLGGPKENTESAKSRIWEYKEQDAESFRSRT